MNTEINFEKMIKKMSRRQRKLYNKMSADLLCYDRVGKKSYEEIIAKAEELGFEHDMAFFDCIFTWAFFNYSREEFLKIYPEIYDGFYSETLENYNDDDCCFYDW